MIIALHYCKRNPNKQTNKQQQSCLTLLVMMYATHWLARTMAVTPSRLSWFLWMMGSYFLLELVQ